MKTDRFIAIAVFVAMAFVALPAFAQDSDSSADTREQRRAQWESMSDEERAAKREERRARHEERRAEWAELARPARRASLLESPAKCIEK